MSDEKKNSQPVSWTICVTLCLAIAGGSWALSGEVHNYRLANITGRLKNHEDVIRQNELNINAAAQDFFYIKEKVDDIYEILLNQGE